MTRIVLLVPTRSRPEQFKRMVESVHKTASCEFIISAYVASDDPMFAEYGKLGLGIDDDVLWMEGPDYPTVYKWNKLAADEMLGNPDLFMLAADDMIFETSGWDKALIDHYNSLENKIHVYALQDSRDPDGTPHIIVSREYINALGYFVPPIFLHWFCDTWTVAIAKSNGCFTHFRDFKLTHDKPSDHGKPDETHSRIRRMGWHERDKYVAETCAHFLEAEKMRLDNYLRKKEYRRWQS